MNDVRGLSIRKIDLPVQDETIRSLYVGDVVALSGVLITGRDAVHRWMIDNFIRPSVAPSAESLDAYETIRPILNAGALYHCGPIVAEKQDGVYEVVSAGPTTSIREEPYQADVIQHFNLKIVIGKGGMGAGTLAACRTCPAVYLHTVGGAAAVIAKSVVRVCFVKKLAFGIPEALWGLEVRDFPAVVTMDSHGVSLHEQVEAASKIRLDQLLA